MSSISEKGNGGTSRLSGRPSIHNHGTDCPFWNHEVMGRYGLNVNKGHEQAICPSHKGTDEVDNVMSKMVRASSPMAIRKNVNVRRNSSNSPKELKQNYTDDSGEDSNLLSKSSPAILSQYSCCSEEAEGVNCSNNTNESANSSLQNRQIDSRTNSAQNLSQNSRRNINSANYNIQHSTQKRSQKLLFRSITIVALVAIAVAYYKLYTTKEQSSNIIYDKYSFYNDIEGVGYKYKISNDCILQVQTGIAAIFEKQDTGAFIFTYNSNRIHFNPVNFNNFISELASAAARYLRNHTKAVRHVIVDSSNLKVQSDKELMDEYIEDVNKTGVMFVKDLDKIPLNVAKAFHYYCDEFNPLVKKSAIFFSLNLARCSDVPSEKNIHWIIEKCLAEKWLKMHEDNLRPLLTRVVNVVVDVTSDF